MGEPSNFNGFSSMHLMADLYRNFSFAGVLFGMFILGVLLRFFYLFCSPCRENGTGLFLYAAIFPVIIHSLEIDLGYAIIIVVRAAILAIVVALILGARFKKVRRAGSPRHLLLAGRPGRFTNVHSRSELLSLRNYF
jgi:ABC-type multidrug transport system permease subunit